VRPNREEFIDLFLENGLQFHPYLNHKRLHNLFENPMDKDFFITVCIEGVLGRTVVRPFGFESTETFENTENRLQVSVCQRCPQVRV
jgi:hypothetical protein